VPSANQVWTSHVNRHKRPASRRPRSGTQTTHHAETALGGGANAVAGQVIAQSTDQKRRRSAVVSPRGVL
jgi:hypothetical protein